MDEVNLDPALVQAVTTLPINEAFIPYLNRLYTKLSYIDSMRGPEIIALKDIEPKLRDAKTKVSNNFTKKKKKIRSSIPDLFMLMNSFYRRFVINCTNGS